MPKRFLKDAFGWGTLLWLIGYILGFILFFIVPPAMIGWAITPIGVAVTLWVLLKKVKGDTLKYYSAISAVWTALAVILDYFLLVRLLNPADGYYKPDVYLYYILTFLLPICVGWWKLNKQPSSA